MTISTIHEDRIELISLIGKTVARAAKGKDDKGYDLLIIEFTDGTVVEAHERGQCGEFRTTVTRQTVPHVHPIYTGAGVKIGTEDCQDPDCPGGEYTTSVFGTKVLTTWKTCIDCGGSGRDVHYDAHSQLRCTTCDGKGSVRS